jgi:hypothetical protein
MVGAENAMVDERMARKRVGKLADRPMHHKSMQQPFEQ